MDFSDTIRQDTKLTRYMDTVELPKLPENQKSFAGIPEALFVEDIEKFMQQENNNSDTEQVLQKLDEQHSKYKFMEMNLEGRRKRLKQQIPDLIKSLKMINVLRKQTTESEAQFVLSEQVMVKANIPPTKTVCLWLGANVMLEYPLDEAEVLLKKNMESAIANLKSVEFDQDFLRDQLTITEVNMARVYNWGVKKRQSALKASGTSS